MRLHGGTKAREIAVRFHLALSQDNGKGSLSMVLERSFSGAAACALPLVFSFFVPAKR